MDDPNVALCVEGQNDLHVLVSLLYLYGAKEDKIWRKSGKKIIFEEKTIGIIPVGGFSGLIFDNLKSLLKDENLKTVGVVFDNDPPEGRDRPTSQSRWTALVASLRDHGYSILDGAEPKTMFNAAATDRNGNPQCWPKISCWPMPSGSLTETGSLEMFFASMITTDQLWKYAENVVDNIDKPVRFSDHKKFHAKVHSWLAWQENPGRPMGETIHKNDKEYTNKAQIDHKTGHAPAFIDWVRTLLPPLPAA